MTKTQAREHQQGGLDPQSSPSQADPGRNPHEQDTRVPFKTIQLTKTKSHNLTREGSEITPGRSYLNHPGARGLHPTGALVRTLWRIKIPSERFYPNHLRLGGYYQGPNTGVPNEVGLITIKR